MGKEYRVDQRRIGASKEQCKFRVLAIERMLSEGRKMTATEIQRRLDLQYDIQVNRKTIYSDIYAIDRFMPIEVIAGKNGGYRKYNVLEDIEDGK
jgi:predicted DNA-binding transcriptional regulator YafY